MYVRKKPVIKYEVITAYLPIYPVSQPPLNIRHNLPRLPQFTRSKWGKFAGTWQPAVQQDQTYRVCTLLVNLQTDFFLTYRTTVNSDIRKLVWEQRKLNKRVFSMNTKAHGVFTSCNKHKIGLHYIIHLANQLFSCPSSVAISCYSSIM